jgi:hypothetical protein
VARHCCRQVEQKDAEKDGDQLDGRVRLARLLSTDDVKAAEQGGLARTVARSDEHREHEKRESMKPQEAKACSDYVRSLHALPDLVESEDDEVAQPERHSLPVMMEDGDKYVEEPTPQPLPELLEEAEQRAEAASELAAAVSSSSASTSTVASN